MLNREIVGGNRHACFYLRSAGEPEDRAFMLDLYEQFERLMFSVARTYGREGDFPEEVVQESLVKLIGKVELLRELSQKSLAAYVAATTRNTAIDYIRARERRNAASLDDEAFSEQESPLPPMDELMGDAERGKRLADALGRLAETDRILLEGKYLLEYSDETLAKQLGCRPASVRAKLTRARRRAFQLLKGEDWT